MQAEFTTGSIHKAMIKFALPYALSMLLQILYGAADLFVVGQFASTADVSAVTIGSQVMNLITQLIIGLATGTTVLIGRYYGAGRQKEMTKTTGTTIILFGLLALFVTLITFFFRNPIVSLMQTPEAAASAALSYLFCCSLGIVFIAAYNVINSILMGLGDTKTPLIFVAAACVINVVLDVVLVKYFHLGAMGAAIATTAAQAGSVVCALVYLGKKRLPFSFGRLDIRPDRDCLVKIIRVGAPVAIQNSLVGASFLFITAIVNQIGLAASAAVGVVEKLMSFLVMPPMAFGAGVSAISAQNLGAGAYERAKKSLSSGIIMSLLPSFLITLFCQLGGETLARLFSTDPTVISLAAQYLKTYALDCILVSFVFCMNGYFNSSGYAWFSLVHSLFTTFAFRVPISYFISRSSQVTLLKMGLAAPASTAASLLLCLGFLWWQGRADRKASLPRPEGGAL